MRENKKATNGRLFGEYKELFLGVFLAEFFHTASGVEHLLFTGVERVTLGTHFNIQIATHGGAGLELVAATASN